MVGRMTHRTLEQKRDFALKDMIDTQADSTEIPLGFLHPVEVRDGEGGIGPDKPHQVTIRVSRDDWLQNRFPSIRTLHIAGAQGAAFQMTKLVEDEQRMIAHAAEKAVPGGAFLRAVGRTDLNCPCPA